VQVFPVSGSEASYPRREQIGLTLDFVVKDLYAVVRQSAPALPEAYWPSGEYGLLFDRDENGYPVPITAVIQDGMLVRLDYHIGTTVEQVLNSIPVAQVILPPDRARAWSAPLKTMGLQSQGSTSEDREWSTYSMIALPSDRSAPYYRRLSVASKDNSNYWVLESQWSRFEHGYSIPMPLYWSSKDPILYWTNVPTPDGCVVFSNASDLYRLDLAAGVSTQLLPVVGQWLAISPDEGRAASVGENSLSVHNLSTGEIQTVSLPTGQAGQIAWAPDGKSLVLTIVHDPCGEAPQHSILRLDTDTMKITILIAKDPRLFATLNWSRLGFVLLTDKDSNTWQMDPQTGQVWNEAHPRSTPGLPTEPSASITEIRFYVGDTQPEERRALERVAEDFAIAYPNSRLGFDDTTEGIDFHNFDPNQYLDYLATTYDCYALRSTLAEYSAPDSALLGLRDLIQKEGPEFIRDFYPTQLEPYRFKNEIYGMPLVERPYLIAYNADLLARLGLQPPSSDWTFADFLSLVTRANASHAGSPIYGYLGDSGDLLFLSFGLGGQGFDPIADLPIANFDSSQMSAALTQLAELRNSGAFLLLKPTLYADADFYAASDALLASQVAFWPSLAGEAWFITEELPAFRVGLAPFPRLPLAGTPDLPYYSQRVQQSFYISQNSANPAACWDWYRFLSERSDVFPGVPARRSVANSQAWEAIVGQENARMLRIALEGSLEREAGIYDQTNAPLWQWQFVAVRDFLDGVDSQTVLAQAQRKADAYINCMATLPLPEMTTEALYAEVRACASQADPSLGW
jgi:ABC-type glycerol-3-phosphate transport system substrate-binding protein